MQRISRILPGQLFFRVPLRRNRASCMFDWLSKGDNTVRLFLVKEVDKSLSGKSDEREVKLCKNSFFTLHPSYLILRKLRFRTAKHKL